MTESNYSNRDLTPARRTISSNRLPRRSLALGLILLSGIGAIAGRAIAEEEFSIPLDTGPMESSTTYTPEPEPVKTWEPAPQESYAEPEPYYEPPVQESYAEPEPYYEPPVQESYVEPEPYYEPPVQESYVEPEPYYEPPVQESYVEPEPYYEPPAVDNSGYSITPPEQPIYLPEKQPTSPPPAAPNANLNSESPANSFIDPTDYNIGATDSYQAPDAVIFSDRSTGCETAVGVGENVSGLCAPIAAPPAYKANGNPNPMYATGATGGGGQPSYPGGSTRPNSTWQQYPASANGGWTGNYASQVPVAGLGPVPAGPVSFSSMTNSGMAYYNRTMRPPKVPGNGDTNLLFPLSIPAPITSLFGWRQHPILGSGRFHTGIDFGADTGTPVVASYSGQVTLADWLGGYGLSVVLNHEQKSQETLYAHLSELFVKPGEFVSQGEAIGRVGNTGLSTGPHLHFELRKLTDQGWVALDPKLEIEFALAQLIGTLRVAEVPSEEFIATLPEKTMSLETGLPQLPPLPPGMDVVVPNIEPPTTNFGFKENVEKARQ